MEMLIEEFQLVDKIWGNREARKYLIEWNGVELDESTGDVSKITWDYRMSLEGTVYMD